MNTLRTDQEPWTIHPNPAYTVRPGPAEPVIKYRSPDHVYALNMGGDVELHTGDSLAERLANLMYHEAIDPSDSVSRWVIAHQGGDSWSYDLDTDWEEAKQEDPA